MQILLLFIPIKLRLCKHHYQLLFHLIICFREDLKQFWTPKIKAHLLPARTVGVQGDGRSYSSLVGLFGEADWDTLFKIAKAIPKTIHQVNRVVYVFSVDGQNPCPDEVPYTITPTRLLPEEIEQLQLADNVVNEVLYKHDLVKSLSQVPVILFVSFDMYDHKTNCLFSLLILERPDVEVLPSVLLLRMTS